MCMKLYIVEARGFLLPRGQLKNEKEAPEKNK